MPSSDAFDRFRKSMIIGFDQWHDGIGYDLDAYAQMSPPEQDAIAAELRGKGAQDWRAMEVLRLHGGADSFDHLRDVLASGTPEQRAYALRELIATGKMAGSVPDVQLAHVLDVVELGNGLTPALLLAREHSGPMSRAALLRGARDRVGVAIHFAGMILFLAGITDSDFAWSRRPFFLRFGKDSPDADRAAAFRELCEMIHVDPTTVPEQGAGRGVDWPIQKRSQNRSNP